MKNIKVTIATILIGILALLGFTSCEDTINGEGENLVYTPIVGNFESIDISVAADITIAYSNDAYLTVEAQSNIYNNMDIYVKNGALVIDFDENVANHNTIILTINMPALRNVSVSGACNIDVTSAFASTMDMVINVSGDNEINFLDTIYCSSFYYNVSGASELNVKSLILSKVFDSNISGDDRISVDNLECDLLKYEISGSGYTSIKGEAVTQTLNASGDLNYNALEFLTQNANIDISGAADIEVNVTDNLNLKNSGATNVSYKGSPSISQDNSGDLTLIPLD